MDTLSLAWRPRSNEAIDALLARPSKPGPAGSRILVERLPGDGRVILFPSFGLVTVEGRTAALRTGDAGVHDLAPVALVAGAADACAAGLAGLCPVRVRGADAEVRRADLAGELTFRKAADGQAFLRALAGAQPARVKTVAWAKGGRVETVYWVNDKSRTVQLRAYDKGVEAGTHAPGERVRIERQHRPAKRARMRPETFAQVDHRDLFLGPLRDFSRSAPATGLSLDACWIVLEALMDSGELSPARARGILGDLAMFGRDDGARYTERTRQRRGKQLADYGLWQGAEPVAADDLVPVRGLLMDLGERWAA